MRKAGKGKRALKIDFSDTETQAQVEEGDYLFRVEDIEQKTSDNSGFDYLSMTCVVEEGQYKGKKIWHNCSLQPQALFNLRGVLEAMGFEVPQGVMELDPTDMIGELFGGSVVLEKYEGKQRARIVEFFAPDELGQDGEDEDDEDEEPKKPAKKAAAAPAKGKGKKAPPVEDDEDEEEDADDEEDDEEEEAPRKSAKKPIAKGKGKKAPVEDEEDEEEEETPRKSAKSKPAPKTPAKGKKAPSPDEDDEDEDEDEEDEEPAPKKAVKGKAKAPAFKVGQKVEFTDDEGDDQTGKITAIDGDMATVKVGKDEWEISIDELTAA